ncbi:hypothetical protein AVEN_123247-1 [Araneus ventricosus]|uniref:Uncharacterized protein n=1 Tax=Araneus ventricosus TaxID=182803 RepID=A0A4Y2KS22_ARAVE|nr:hypothetical protein AVEN_123247-1 [Araneus ventricosus]
MLSKGSHIPALLCVPIRRSPMGSSRVSAGATPCNHHTQLLDSRRSPLGTAQRLKSYAEGHRHVGTIHFGVGATVHSQQSRLLHPAKDPSAVDKLTFPRKIMVQ